MHNPLRTEAEVFRLVVVIVGAAALVVALALITEPIWGVLLAVLLIAIGIGAVWRVTRGSEPRSVAAPESTDDTRRILVVANQTAAGRELLEEIRNRCRGVDCEVLLVSPALVGSRAERWASDIDEGLDLARERMARSVTALRGVGVDVRAEVGDPDPNMAIEDALRTFPADEIVISTLPPGESRWLEHDVVERTRSEVELPMTHVIVELEAGRAALPGSHAAAPPRAA
jgi:GABA permease